MSAISTSKISEFSDNDIVAKFSECAPLYKLWLTKFIKYHDSNKARFRASKGVSIFGIALGVVLLVGTAGAYNYFSKK
jgi:hypothetical protein